MSNPGNIKLEVPTNKQLNEISRKRYADNNLIWRKKDIIAELVAKAYKREL